MNKTNEKNKSVKNGIARFVAVVLAVLFEIGSIFLLFLKFNYYAEWITVAVHVIAFVLAIAFYNSDRTSAIKTPWIMLILTAPVAGVFLYLLIGMNPYLSGKRNKYRACHADHVEDKLTLNLPVWEELHVKDPYSANVARYIYDYSGYPVYHNDSLTYYDQAKNALEAQKKALREAEQFIFMEYYAIEDAEAWAGIQEILVQKASEGVDVRLIYDDMGSIGFIDTEFSKRLEKLGIKCRIFNAFFPGLNLFLNNRDHRKLTVIDGQIGFTGGYNLANEYFNLTHPYGYWKDTGIRFTGEAVRSLTAAFLEMWDMVNRKKPPEESDHFYRDVMTKPAGRGYIQPYGESPMLHEHLAENVYIGLVEASKDYIWFVTPYLILTDEMNHALSAAAKRGVDVRIITPGIPDKRTVYSLTRSFYHNLAKNGVKIYEYVPGFCHCKMCVSDDVRAACGTINLDYRSLYHHFENGCVYYCCDAVWDTRRDFEAMMRESKEVSEYYAIGRGSILKIKQMVLRLFAQLM